MKNLRFSIGLLFGILLTIKSIAQDHPSERVRADFEKIKSTISGIIPFPELEKARNYTIQRINQIKNASANAAIPFINWSEKGPRGIGGRTRALMFDPNDVQYKKVWAGGAAGGLWYNNDITDANAVWNKVDDFWDNIAISCIAASPQNSQVFYVGTGEGWNNLDAVRGGGIWKTTNGGVTWSRLASTIPSTNTTFSYIQKIQVNTQGQVFAGTKQGLMISNDGGLTWSLATTIGSQTITDIEIAADGVIYAATNPSKIYKTNNVSNDGTSWTNITPPATYGYRTEIALSNNLVGSNQVIYATSINNTDNFAWFKKSTNAGITWTDLTIPTWNGSTNEITSNQGWYDLIIKISPINANLVIIGGAEHSRSTDGGQTWVSGNIGIHTDHHAVEFKPNNSNEVIMGNDGGIYYSPNYGDPNIHAHSVTASARNNGYSVTQFYTVAIKNIANDNYILGGTQDNGTLKVDISQQASVATGGDGVQCFIDKDDANVQISSYIYNNYYLLNRNGVYQKAIIGDSNSGVFLNPADYDSQNNILYTYKNYGSNSTSFYVVTEVGSNNVVQTVTIAQAMSVSFIKVGLLPNTIFVGTSSGGIYKITDFRGSSPTITRINLPANGFTSSGEVSSIDFGSSDNELLVTLSNYDTKSVWYTSTQGAYWISKDENSYGLPNIPVRYGIFNPLDKNQVFLATELGVWTSNDFNAINPNWTPTNANLANVRCDMLIYREADKKIVVATHGRGIFTTNLLPCQNGYLSLVSPTNDVLNGQDVLTTATEVNAKNRIANGGTNMLRVRDKITLSPNADGSTGFKAANGSTFIANVNGCY